MITYILSGYYISWTWKHLTFQKQLGSSKVPFLSSQFNFLCNKESWRSWGGLCAINPQLPVTPLSPQSPLPIWRKNPKASQEGNQVTPHNSLSRPTMAGLKCCLSPPTLSVGPLMLSKYLALAIQRALRGELEVNCLIFEQRLEDCSFHKSWRNSLTSYPMCCMVFFQG